MILKYRQAGFENMCRDLILIQFDKDNGVLTTEDICTFVNYMSMCSANGSRIMKMLNMSKGEIKKEITKLKEVGY